MSPEPKQIARSIHRGLHDGGVPQNQYGSALLWAFGAYCRKIQIKQWFHYWNWLHGDIFTLKKDEKLYIMLKRIGEEYAKL